MNKFYLLLLLSTLLHSQFTNGQGIDRELDEYISSQTDMRKCSGTVLVSHQGKIIFQKSYGFANIEKKKENKLTTQFRIGSITKQFTAVLIMQLVEQKKINLNDMIADHLPKIRLKTRATIKELLNQTSGIQDYTEVNLDCDASKQIPIDNQKFAKCFSMLISEFEPGTKFSYSNTNYYLLGLLIEKVEGKPFEQVLKANILTPLQMGSTGYLDNRNLHDLAQGYKMQDEKLTSVNIEDVKKAYSAGGMYSTVDDLFKWDQALRTDKLLRKESRDQIFAENKSVDPGFYGFGWYVGDNSEFNDYRAFHEGGIDGFSACIDRYIDNEVCIIVLSNFEFTESRVDFTEPIAKIVFKSIK